MATLDVSGSWEAGDEYRMLEALELPNGFGYLDQLILCMNRLTSTQDAAVIRVRTELDRYEAAYAAKAAADLAATEGKTLVKADVLEWQVGGVGTARVTQELVEAQQRIANYFAFCDYVPPAEHYELGGQPTLYRS